MLHHNTVQRRGAGKACHLCSANEMRSIYYRKRAAQELHCVDNSLLMQLLYLYLMAVRVLEHTRRRQQRQQRQQRWLSVCEELAFVSLSL